jgi:hypothetical protein
VAHRCIIGTPFRDLDGAAQAGSSHSFDQARAFPGLLQYRDASTKE